MTKWVEVKIQYKKVMLLCSMVFLLTTLCIPAWSLTEVPLNLPQVEGSKSFDLEISQINKQAVQKYCFVGSITKMHNTNNVNTVNLQ